MDSVNSSAVSATAAAASAKPAADKEALRKFYFSQSASFGTFKTAHDKRADHNSPSPTRGAQAGAPNSRPGNVSLSGVEVSNVSTINQSGESLSATSPDAAAAAAAEQPQPHRVGVGMNAARAAKDRKASTSGVAAPGSSGAKPSPANGVNVASPGYFNFLRQQQDLQRQHNRAEEAVATLETSRRAQQGELAKLRRQAAELLRDIEAASDWQLRSKYDLQQLIRDCTLSLQPIELTGDVAPQSEGIAQLGNHLAALKRAHGDSVQFAAYNLFVDQATRRLSLLEGVLAKSNLDATATARIPDTLVVQLERVCKQPTVESIVSALEEAIDVATFKAEEAQRKRVDAVSDGEVHIAERLCYEIVAQHESMLGNVIQKARLLEGEAQENAVLEKVRGQYAAKASDEFEKIKVRSTKLKARCEEDLKKMFALREKVEEVEAATSSKVMEERARSEAALQDNARRMEAVFVQMDELEKALEGLERERHREIQKRLVEKDKDEHRRAEFAQFCAVVDGHVTPLERTIRNMDVAIHAAEAVADLVSAGFTAVRDDLAERDRLLRDVKLEAHKQHVEVLRGLMVELGELVYKKERMVEETDKNIQASHIQQELLAETFNPNAKRFGDIKKRLLLNRDELETDVRDLKRRASATLEDFRYSEAALATAGVEFLHPVTEQEHHTLALRAKMMEFKAMAIGHCAPTAATVVPSLGTSSSAALVVAASATGGSQAPSDLVSQIEELKAAVNETRQEIDVINASTSGTMSKALPMIRAATRARRTTK